MWWKVYCNRCNEKFMVYDSFDLELTCMKVGCSSKVKKIKQIEKKEVDRELAISRLGFRDLLSKLKDFNEWKRWKKESKINERDG